MKLAPLLIAAILIPSAPCADTWRPLIGKDLKGWEVEGESVWTIRKDGTLIGQRPLPSGNTPTGPFPMTAAQYRKWLTQQSWLYTLEEFSSFDLHVEFWVPVGGNSGVSLHDKSWGRQSFGDGPIQTPAHLGYEIQILGYDADTYPSGSIYTLQAAKTGLWRADDWNSMDIECRPDRIRVTLNGQLAAEHAPDPARPTSGPIGLQLHDRFSWVMFRNIRIREVKP